MDDLHKSDLEEMNKLKKQKKDDKKGKWEFEDYAFTITGIVVAFLLIGPEILYEHFGISILGGSLSGGTGGIGETLAYGLAGYGAISWDIAGIRALSPMLFMSTTAICFIHDAIAARKTGGYEGSVFTHTFESLVEDAIYMTITTIMVFGAVLFGMMYISWLAGPITWILFMVIFPIVRKKTGKEEELEIPWLMLIIFAAGVIAEVFTGAWIAFPVAWLIICAKKLRVAVRELNNTVDSVFEVLYYTLSVIMMILGVTLNFWIASWAAFPIAMFICWTLSKFPKYRKNR